MRMKRAQTRAADHAASSSDSHIVGLASVPDSVVSSAASKQLKRPHTATRPQTAPKDNANAKKCPTKLAKNGKSDAEDLASQMPPITTDTKSESTKRNIKKFDNNATEISAQPEIKDIASSPKIINTESQIETNFTGIEETPAPATKPIDTPVKQPPSVNKRRKAQSTTRPKSQIKNNTKRAIARKETTGRKDKQTTTPSKELKNLGIQITGFNGVLNNDTLEVSSQTNIKASISEIVKTKSRASASYSIFSKTATAATGDKTKTADQLDLTSQTITTESPPENTTKAIKDSTKKSSKKSTQTSKMPINKRTSKSPTTATQKAKLSTAADETNLDELEIIPGHYNTESNDQSEIDDKVKQTHKPPTKEKQVIRKNPKTSKPIVTEVHKPTSSKSGDVSENIKDNIASPSAETSVSVVKDVKSKPTTAKRTKASNAKPRKPRPSASKRKPAIPKRKTNAPTETTNSPLIVFSLQASDTLPFVNSPSFSDPDTVTSPLVPPDASDSNQNHSTGNSHIRKMVEDILEGLEMSDDVSSNEKPFSAISLDAHKTLLGVDIPVASDVIELKPIKLEKISVKSIESMTRPDDVKPVEDKKVTIKKEVKLQMKDELDDSNLVKSKENLDSVPEDAEKLSDPIASMKVTTNKRKKSPAKRATKSKTTQPTPGGDNSKDIYDFHESGHSSEDASVVSYIKNAKKDDVNEADKSPADTNLPKSNETKKKIAKQPTKKCEQKPRAIDNLDKSGAENSDSSDNKALATKISSKQSIEHNKSGGSSGGEGDSGSDTSVRTRVNNRRKSAVKSRRLKLFGFYTGPKRHRMASLNALAKVQCLYENEQRTAQELGFVREPRVAPKVRLAVNHDTTRAASSSTTSSTANLKKALIAEDNSTDKCKKEAEASSIEKKVVDKTKPKKEDLDENVKKESTAKPQEEPKKKEPDRSSSSESESEKEEEKIDIDAPRTLRTVPGLRGAGKLWEMGNMSSFQSDSDQDYDETYDQKPDKPKQKKKPVAKRANAAASKASKANKPDKPKAKPKPKLLKRPVAAAKSSSSSENEEPEAEADLKAKSKSKKKKVRTVESKTEFKDLVVRKRIASLNATAMLAASYEVERHLDMDSLYNGSSADSEIEVPASPKKIKDIKSEVVEDVKETRPMSTNVVIVQDTDVTITGVYVNSSLGSSQEAYCKMQYRVQSSVTEERMVLPGQEQPPKSYTPLSALSCMLPPGSGDSALSVVENVSLDQPDTLSPPMPSTSSFMPLQPSHHQHMAQSPHYVPYPPHMHHPQHMQQPPLHHVSQQQPPQLMAIHRQSPPPHCESPFRYEAMYAQPPHPPPPSMGQGSSAFCAIGPPQSEANRYYQPAGPLITSHMVAGHPGGSKSGLDSEPMQLLQPSSSVAQPQIHAGGADNPDGDILITGDRGQRPPTYRYAQGPPPPGSHGPMYARPIHQMHCQTYPPATYYSPYQQHPPEVCYTPPYQTAYYPSSYRRYVPNSAYYQPGDVYSAPPTTTGGSGPAPSLTSSVGSLIAAPDGAGHSGHPMPPHMDHYAPTYYTAGYSPGGGQCYNRSMPPPYLDSSSFQSSCPCPMQQSFPKNVHTGPLIGSKTSKGPVQSSQPIAFNDTTTAAPASSVQTTQAPPRNAHISAGGPTVQTASVTQTTTTSSSSASNQPSQIPFKQEIPDDILPIPVVVKPEHDTTHAYHINSILQVKTSKSPDTDNVRMRPNPNPMRVTSMGSSQIPEPEMSISPARGSAGLQTPPAQDCAVQPSETPIVRRARLGKSMAREMMMISQQQHQSTLISPANGTIAASTAQPHQNRLIAHTEFQSSSISHHSERTANEITEQNSRIELNVIKPENVKIEADDDVVCLEKDDDQRSIVDLCQSEKSSPTIVPPNLHITRPSLKSSKRKSKEPIEVIDVDNSTPDVICTTPVFMPLKKPKILEQYKGQTKKSPPNSYKNLIKPSAPKPYLCNADGKSARKSRFRFIRGEPRYGVHHREVLINGKHRKLLIPNGRPLKRRVNKPKPQAQPVAVTNTTANTVEDIQVKTDVAANDDRVSSPLTYDPTTSNNRDTSSTEDVVDSVKSNKQPTIITDGKDTDANVEATTGAIESTSKELLRTAEDKSNFLSSLDLTIDRVALGYFSDQETVTFGRSTRVKRKTEPDCGKRSKSETSKNSRHVSTKESNTNNNDCSKVSNQSVNTNTTDNSTTSSQSAAQKQSEETACDDTVVTPESTSEGETLDTTITNETPVDITMVEDRIYNHNNNNYNNNNIDYDEMAFSAYKHPTKPTTHRKSRSRGAKFSSRKRHRVRQAPPETEEILAPRKSNVTPRWSNGWSWQGESFQGKVFLNSDDQQVVRRRYASMVHDGGDVIRPGDCVLLRAGSKKNELPFVAKVASLWENPEDGEMMMSLLWYYRPEHTEQGRLQHDCADEVFASRHQDHNSVACIEDKCYVLTFNEYCRYRKSVKALEEGIVTEPPHAFMTLPHLDRDLPANINTELVLFCRRVYEFRLKRLIKNPT